MADASALEQADAVLAHEGRKMADIPESDLEFAMAVYSLLPVQTTQQAIGMIIIQSELIHRERLRRQRAGSG